MAAAFEYVYLHGFRGDVCSEKGKIFQRRMAEKGIDLHILDVKGGKGHEDTRVSLGLQTLDNHYKAKEKRLRLIGSSMGGLISAVYATQNPTHVDRVVLLNPAVNLEHTWITITDPDDDSQFDKWKENGSTEFVIPATGEKAQIPFAYVEDSLQLPSYPNLPCPSVLILGSKDVIIPPKYGYIFQLEQEDPEQMKVIELDDDHTLMKPESVDTIMEEITKFFQ